MSFTFNGIKKGYLRALVGIERPAWAPIEEEIIEIPGRAGGIITGEKIKVRRLNIPVRVYKKGFASLEDVEEDLAAWLITYDPKPLTFPHKPDRTYYAKVTGELVLDEYPEWGEGVISFICPDPYKYGAEKEVTFESSASFDVEGTVETEPVIEVELKDKTTFLAVSNGDQLNMIGQYANVDQQVYERETRVFWDQLGSLVGWTNSTSVEDSISSGGQMETNGHEFFVTDYGSGGAWHGPAVKTSIGEIIQDFRCDVLLTQFGGNWQLGGVEVALLDVNNQFVAKMQMFKRSELSPAITATLRAGTISNGFDIINSYGSYLDTWKDFEGMLRIGRIGDEWFAYVTRIDAGGNHDAEMYRTWKDTYNIANTPIAQVQVQIVRYGEYDPTFQRLKDIKIFRYNQQEGIPYVAKENDKVTFNHLVDLITLNGEDYTREKSFIGEYFPLIPGRNSIVIEPADVVKSAKVRFRPKWR
ncbi:distal tail protein Dit [Caldifermentibacillus hisashii]|uniref:distal tail protein Dit n=1 Tax=Caldifermentibacillus hisashii TaxID=996558 RepID=UPI0030E99CDC